MDLCRPYWGSAINVQTRSHDPTPTFNLSNAINIIVMFIPHIASVTIALDSSQRSKISPWEMTLCTAANKLSRIPWKLLLTQYTPKLENTCIVDRELLSPNYHIFERVLSITHHGSTSLYPFTLHPCSTIHPQTKMGEVPGMITRMGYRIGQMIIRDAANSFPLPYVTQARQIWTALRFTASRPQFHSPFYDIVRLHFI
jgi:hypothetical protein